MEITDGTEEAFVREWTPCNHILNLIPPRTQNGIFSSELNLTCVDAVSDFIALGTNFGLVYWYDRKKGNIQRLRCEMTNSPITYVKIVNTVDYMVGAGNAAGQVTVFQIPKEHPENVPDTYKPKVEPKVERYTIGDLHKSKVTAIEWSKNGMRLFSGDKNGVIIMTEIDFYMHLCKSMEIVNEEHEIVQLSYHQSALLVSSLYRTIVCEKRDGKWRVNQIGKKERKRETIASAHNSSIGAEVMMIRVMYEDVCVSLCRLGAVFQHSYARGAGGAGGAGGAYCARAGLRLWRADAQGDVHQTLLFKDAISNPLTVAELLNPCKRSPNEREHNFGPLHVFREHFLVSHDDATLFVLDPRSLTAVAVVDDLRKILSVSVNKDEIFVLEGPRSLLRLAHTPEPASMAAEGTANLMTKSLTTSIQQAVNTVRDLTHIDQTVPFITSVLEQPISIFTKTDNIETGVIVSGEECFELPPIQQLPDDIPDNVLESIINEFKDVSSEAEEIRRVKTEELQKKLKIYDSIMQKKSDEELIHKRKTKRRDEKENTPRLTTPVRKSCDQISYTGPCVMNVSIYNNIPENDDLLEKQIEEKEKMLAKMLNLESLSIKPPDVVQTEDTEPMNNVPKYRYNEEVVNFNDHLDSPKPIKKPLIKIGEKPVSKNTLILDSIPKIAKLPNNWNLENIELKLELQSNGMKSNDLVSPDDNLDSEWEIV